MKEFDTSPVVLNQGLRRFREHRKNSGMLDECFNVYSNGRRLLAHEAVNALQYIMTDFTAGDILDDGTIVVTDDNGTGIYDDGNWLIVSEGSLGGISGSGSSGVGSDANVDFDDDTDSLIDYKDDGTSEYLRVGSPKAINPRDVATSDAGEYILVCGGFGGARAWLSSDYGKSFTEVQPKGDVNASWSGCDMSTNGLFQVICEEGGTVYYSNDYGVTWNTTGLPTSNWF